MQSYCAKVNRATVCVVAWVPHSLIVRGNIKVLPDIHAVIGLKDLFWSIVKITIPQEE